MAPPISQFPLEKITGAQLLQLGHTLWSWPLCEDCNNGKACTMASCPSHRSKRLGRFYQYYKDLTASYDPDTGPGQGAALRKHEDLFRIIHVLKEEPDLTRAQFLDKLFADRPSRRPPSAADQGRAINLAVQIMVAVKCSAQHQSSDVLEHGICQIPWRSDVTFSQFLMDLFPMTDHPSLNDDDVVKSLGIKEGLMAKKLKKRAGLKFEPTDDLGRHLKFDRKTAVVELYHHTAFLKEHLRLTMGKPRNMTMADSLKLGALPRQLALETLDSIQKILFPLSDPESRSLLHSLTSTSSLDPDTLRFESASIRTTDEKDIPYHYFGARFADLYEELENPTPRGIDKWFERRSGARYVMMATLVGVAVAVLLGILGLAVGIYQAWVGYQQWQHPVQI